jgi:hypothetical protein
MAKEMGDKRKEQKVEIILNEESILLWMREL